jgi:hypothetical protein
MTIITDLHKLSKNQQFRVREINGRKVNDKRVWEFLKPALRGEWLTFGLVKDKKKYRDIYYFTARDTIKVEIIPQQSDLFSKNKAFTSNQPIK